jgi:hypothetical protein
VKRVLLPGIALALSQLATFCGSSLVSVPNATGDAPSTAAKTLDNAGLAYNSQGVNGTINALRVTN